MDLSRDWPVHTIELGSDFVTAYFFGETPDLPGLLEHDPERFHDDCLECFWVNDYFGPDAHDNGYYKHLHAKTLEPFTGLYDPRILDGISIHHPR